MKNRKTPMENPYEDPSLLERVKKRIVGREKEIRMIIAALAAGRNILLEGPPGTTKSTILRTIAEESGVPFFMVEGSADLTPQKLVGIFNPAKVMSEGFKPEYFEPGPLTLAMEQGGILYIEEFNRMPEEAANALIRATEERELVIPRYGVVKARPSFRVICAMNPYDEIGTTRISRALMDRFCRLKLDYQSREEEIEIVKLRTGCNDKWLVELAVDVARETRRHPSVRMGASVRGAIDMVLIAEEMKKMYGELGLEELLDAAILAMSGKIWLNNPDVSAEEVIREVLFKVLGLRRGPFSNPLRERGRGTGRSSKRTDGRFEENEKESYREELVKRNLDVLARLARLAPTRVSIELAKDPRLVISILRYGLKKNRPEALELYALASSLLKEEARRIARRYATMLAIRLASSRVRGLRIGKLSWEKFTWDYSDIDLDRTFDKIAEKGVVDLEDIVVMSRRRVERTFALIVDRSASMAGYKLALAAIAAATLAYAARGIDYAVLAFNTEIVFLKRLGDQKSAEEVVDDILSLRACGYTDIAKALSAAYHEIMRRKPEKAIAILITDGEWTAGENPLFKAPLFNRLYVLAVPSKWRGFCMALAERGHGRCVFIRDLGEVPDAIYKIVRES